MRATARGSRWGRSVAIALLLCLPLPSASSAESERAVGIGRVVAVDEDRAALMLDHGPIPGLMPAMRMQFSVRHQGLLHGLEVGGVVRFSLEPRGGEWVITAIEPVPAAASARSGVFPAPDFVLSTPVGRLDSALSIAGPGGPRQLLGDLVRAVSNGDAGSGRAVSAVQGRGAGGGRDQPRLALRRGGPGLRQGSSGDLPDRAGSLVGDGSSAFRRAT